jgi:gamma-glutamylcyclotransferase (GGCT)/AIG2-like uncharacterized protein YtfP
MTEMKFFVYGSMSEGLVHFKKIQDFVTEKYPATILGSAYRLKVGYPVVLSEGTDLIPGEVVHLQATDLLISLLDEFHGYNRHDETSSLYFRREVGIHKSDGTEETVWTYYLNPKKLPANAALIVGGDWQTALRAHPPLTGKLTDRQKAYILRLGKSTGREIIPIEMPLYRELMNLEMIVDKGRRLALSKTGHEVFRYLS